MLKSSVSWLNTVNRSLKFQPDVLYQQGIPVGRPPCYRLWGVEENDIGHTLRSVLIDPERRLMKVFEGTDWRPEVAERDIQNILKAYNL